LQRNKARFKSRKNGTDCTGSEPGKRRHTSHWLPFEPRLETIEENVKSEGKSAEGEEEFADSVDPQPST